MDHYWKIICAEFPISGYGDWLVDGYAADPLSATVPVEFLDGEFTEGES